MINTNNERDFPTIRLFNCSVSLKEFYKCRKCGYEALTEYFLHRHIQDKCMKIARGAKPRQCKKCMFKTYSSLTFLSHYNNDYHYQSKLSTLDIDNDKGLNCRYCGETFTLNNYLKWHIMLEHTPNETKLRKCEHCDYKTAEQRNLKAHITVKHTPDDEVRWFQCEECDYKSIRNDSLRKHKLVKHTLNHEVPWFQCDYCPYKSQFSYNLKAHRLLKHKLAYENTQIANQSLVKNEKKVCEKTTQFKCDECDYKGNKRYYVTRHKLNVHTASEGINWNKCDKCEYKSKKNSDLKRHILVKHTAEENINWLFCYQCSYKTPLPTYLKRHRLLKHGLVDLEERK